MKRYSFSVDPTISLNEVCSKGFKSVSLMKTNHGRPIYIFLSNDDGSALKIQSVMHDIGPRLEVGSLVFNLVVKNDPHLETKNLPSCFSDRLTLSKLLYINDQSIVESGIAMTASGGEELLIVSGVFPFTVEVCVEGLDQDFDPEYPINDYKREIMRI